jgi:hypothetical protein
MYDRAAFSRTIPLPRRNSFATAGWPMTLCVCDSICTRLVRCEHYSFNLSQDLMYPFSFKKQNDTNERSYFNDRTYNLVLRSFSVLQVMVHKPSHMSCHSYIMYSLSVASYRGLIASEVKNALFISIQPLVTTTFFENPSQ